MSGDHFGGHAALYAAHRPTYPEALFDWIGERAPARGVVWDCGTGTGQAARGLARVFARVEATDLDGRQIAQASPHRRIRFREAPAEASGLEEHSVDAVTVAEALHWFDHEAFFKEVRRVLRPGGVIVAWGYHAHHVTPAIDEATRPFLQAVQPYWPPRRQLLDDDYRDIRWPFEPLDPPGHPDVSLSHEWTAEQLLDYLRTWSSTKRYEAAHQEDPVERIASAVREAWGPGARTVTWTTCWKTGRV